MRAVIGKGTLGVIAVVAAAALATLVLLAYGPTPERAGASSHREAPLISEDPTADNTDVYAFVSPDRPNTVTIIANYIPLEEPAGGPNFAKFGDDVQYRIHVDNDGDARDDVTFLFQFKTEVRNPNTFLYNTGPITSLDDPDFNVRQTYSLVVVKDRVPALFKTGIATPPVNIGPRSTPNYDALAAAAVTDAGGGIKTFAGQRDDPFYVDLGSVFDLLGLRPFNSLHVLPLAPTPGVDGVAGFNTHTIAIQVPISMLVRPSRPTIGIYASSSRAALTTIQPGKKVSLGPQVQVSRLGNPLINEVVIPLQRKDQWNGSSPAEDAQFEPYYRSPEVARLANALYPVLDNARESNRDDLVTILLTGIPGVNFTGPIRADLLRLNTSIPPSGPVGSGNRLGAIAGDLAGFPNGRRLEDDVTDIEVRAIMEGYGPFLNAVLGLPNRSPNNLLGDGVDTNDRTFLPTFPYVATPHQGYAHEHH